ncbi:glycosyl hydrolase family 88, partial [Enterococcus faecalis]
YDKKTNTGADECMIWGDYFYLEALTALAKSRYSFC